MEFTNRICPNCNDAIIVALGDFSKPYISEAYKYRCMSCNSYFRDIDFEKESPKESETDGRVGEVGMDDRDKAYLLKELTKTIDETDSTAAFCLCQRWILKDALSVLKEQETELKTLKEEYRVLLEQYDTAHKLITTQQKRIKMFEYNKGWDEYPDRMGGGAW